MSKWWRKKKWRKAAVTNSRVRRYITNMDAFCKGIWTRLVSNISRVPIPTAKYFLVLANNFKLIFENILLLQRWGIYCLKRNFKWISKLHHLVLITVKQFCYGKSLLSEFLWVRNIIPYFHLSSNENFANYLISNVK